MAKKILYLQLKKKKVALKMINQVMKLKRFQMKNHVLNQQRSQLKKLKIT